MAGLLDIKATAEEWDHWFDSTSRTDWIPRLPDAIRKWQHEDLSKLKLAERLTQEKIVELLKTAPPGSGPVIHLLMVYNQKSTLISLLDRVTPQHILSIFRMRYIIQPSLSAVSMPNVLYIYPYVTFRVGIDVLYILLCETDENGRTVLYWAVEYNCSVCEVLSLLKDETRSHHLLSIRDNEGLSALSRSIYKGCKESFQSIIRYYTGKQAELLELAAIPDDEGNTSFHYAAGQKTSNYLTDLMKAACSPETRGQLANVLSMRNDRGRMKVSGYEVGEIHSENKFIYNWAFNSLTNHRYLMFGFPSVLIMYNTVSRNGADEEALSLERCLTSLGFEVRAKSSFTKKELFEAIKDHQMKQASRNGQIVALMSHGSEGYIADSDDQPISLKEIERRMCADSHRDTPKLLILQCCQSSNFLDANSLSVHPSSDPRSWNFRPAEDDSPPASYCPRNRDFCALMSTGSGTYSERNCFIPFLAEAICSSSINASVAEVMNSVKRHFPVNITEQAPGCTDWFTFDFCIKNILPVYLNITAKVQSKSVKRKRQEPSTESTKLKPKNLKKINSNNIETGKRKGGGNEQLNQATGGPLWENNFIQLLPKEVTQASNTSENSEVSPLSSKDVEGLSELAHSIYKGNEESFQSIIADNTDKRKLLKLAAIPDKNGNTSFHYAAGQKTPRFLIDLIKATCSSETREQLADILLLRNISGAKIHLGYEVEEFHFENEPIYDWAFNSLKKDQYLLFELPSVLVMFTTAGRPGAEEEAQHFIKTLESFGLHVEQVKDFTEERLFEEIDNSQNSRDKNGQIIALMCHGVLGAIKDNKGKEIQLKGIEESMRGPGGCDTPKVMILQCCQSFKREVYKDAFTQTCIESLEIKTSLGEPNTSKAPASVIQEETIEHTAEQQEGEPNEELGSLQFSTEADGHLGSKYRTFYPTARHFGLLMSCSPYRASTRNLFIPELGKALKELQPDENIATLMNPVTRSVREASKGDIGGEQASSLLSLLEFDLCIKNILPLHLAIKREEGELTRSD